MVGMGLSDLQQHAVIRSFICNTKRPVKQSIKLQVSSNFQIYPWGVKLMGPPFETARPQSELLLFNVINESPFEMVNL